jgi:NAD+ dependent glucose-6-phosphate dehydrogenase
MADSKPLKVHITGVYGLIGNLVYRHLHAQPERYDVYGSGRRTMSSTRADAESILRLPDDHFMIADLADADAVAHTLAGMDAVLHIGAVPNPDASFQQVLDSNIRGTHHVLEACRLAGIKRMVYASSIMASWGYFIYEEPYRSIREGRLASVPDPVPPVTHLDPVRPTEPYSASKVWAEGYCRTYVDAHGMSIVCLRIGGVNKENAASTPVSQAVWCSHRDVVNITERALIATEKPIYDICYAVSDNRYRWVDMAHTRDILGYTSQDRAEESV